jgi:hypothetical protein
MWEFNWGMFWAVVAALALRGCFNALRKLLGVAIFEPERN